MRQFRSHGTGIVEIGQFRRAGENVVMEAGTLAFHPERISLGSNVYIGHGTILKGYYQNDMIIGDDVWIGQHCFFHGAGGLTIGNRVGIGPGVRILTSSHRDEGYATPILASELVFAPVSIGDDSDIGVGAIVLPGVMIGRGVQVGAGAVVATNLPDHCVAAGVPARVIRQRVERVI